MRFSLHIDLDNAAFEDSQGEEVCRLLREAGSVAIQFVSGIERMHNYKLRDINGNTVGNVTVFEDKFAKRGA